jgi:diadenosine tetraphosphatase ApaH/serine/threonine PP2A family protein phosphatase
MRYAVLGDIHANWDAFRAVLKDIEGQHVDAHLCVGDIVGYGAEPAKCVKAVRQMGFRCVVGNHDHAAIGRLDINYFNYHAREAVEWTRAHLSIAAVEFLGGLDLVTEVDGVTLGHGTIHRPERFGYIETVFAAQLSFHAMNTRLAFLGHSHVPIAFLESEGQDSVTYTQSTELELRHVAKAIVNVGSVGQPRDDDPRACYAVYDSDAQMVELHRVEYDIEAAQAKIRNAGLPDVLAARLALGR